MLRRRLAVTAILLFFLGLPLAGMLFVYFHAHGAIRASALHFAESDVVPILQKRDYGSLQFLATLTLKKELSREKFDAEMDRLGPYGENGGFKVLRSSVGERGDEVWQFVDLECLVRFERGTVRLDLTAARRSLALNEWRIERFQLLPQNVEQVR